MSYPKWDGKAILHDPTYAVCGETIEETKTGAISGFEFVTFLLSIPLVSVIIRRKRQ
ncbi:MAG: Heimdall-CTERM domain-containing surface protein [Candidatus Hodarchaeales archaeon]